MSRGLVLGVYPWRLSLGPIPVLVLVLGGAVGIGRDGEKSCLDRLMV